ncbi:MAG: hypothetical protein J2P18_08900 [Nocardia sp.]|nr:hypothetical protein [Nocardia sp.]
MSPTSNDSEYGQIPKIPVPLGSNTLVANAIVNANTIFAAQYTFFGDPNWGPTNAEVRADVSPELISPESLKALGISGAVERAYFGAVEEMMEQSERIDKASEAVGDIQNVFPTYAGTTRRKIVQTVSQAKDEVEGIAKNPYSYVVVPPRATPVAPGVSPTGAEINPNPKLTTSAQLTILKHIQNSLKSVSDTVEGYIKIEQQFKQQIKNITPPAPGTQLA